MVHSLFYCKNARVIWANSRFAMLVEGLTQMSCAEIMLGMVEQLTPHEFMVFAALAWAAWCCRNKAMFEDGEPRVYSTAQGFIDYVLGWADYNSKVSAGGFRPPQVLSSNAWSCPPLGWIKVNVDAHVGCNGVISELG